jgi:heterodisulfide reductase subunit A
LIDQGSIALDPSVAQVDQTRCAGCGQCVASCPYGALALVDDVVDVNEYLCKGCGTCAATCPNKAMTLIHFDDQQLIDEIIGALMVDSYQIP